MPSSALPTCLLLFAVGCTGGTHYTGIDGGADDDDDGGGDGVLLTVNVSGNGVGSVTSDPPGIDCPGDCSARFVAGTEVELAATPEGSVFLGWSDACSGTGNCVVTLDQDATVGAFFGTPGEALWFRQIGDTSTGDTTVGVAVDADGNVAVLGKFTGTVDVGGEVLIANATQNMYVAKLDGGTGTAIWVKQFGATSLNPGGVATDAVGNVVVVGGFGGSIDFGGGTLTSAGSNDVFVAKFSAASGAYGWQKRFGGAGIDDAHAVAIDTDGDVAIAGSFRCASQPCTSQPSLTFGGSSHTNVGNADLFVAKLTGVDGSHVWSKMFGSTGNDIASGVGSDSEQNIVAIGEFAGTINFGGGNRVSAGLADVLLLKLDGADGAHLYSLRFGSTSDDRGHDLAIGSAGQVFAIGSFNGTVNFGGAQSLSAGAGEASFVAKYTLAGAHAWSSTFTTTGEVFAGAVAAGGPGFLTLLGSFCGTLTLDVDLSAAGTCPDHDVFIAAYSDVTGDPIRSVRHGGTGSEIGFDVAQSIDGNIYGAGNFTGFAEFAGAGYTSHGGTDGFVVGLGPLN